MEKRYFLKSRGPDECNETNLPRFRCTKRTVQQPDLHGRHHLHPNPTFLQNLNPEIGHATLVTFCKKLNPHLYTINPPPSSLRSSCLWRDGIVQPRGLNCAEQVVSPKYDHVLFLRRVANKYSSFQNVLSHVVTDAKYAKNANRLNPGSTPRILNPDSHSEDLNSE